MINLEKTRDFLFKRFKGDIGGFSGTPLLSPTLEDTFYGLKTLIKIDRELIERYKQNIINFLINFADQNKLQVEHAFKIIEIFKLLNSQIEEYHLKIKSLILKFQKQISNFKSIPLYRLYCLWTISKNLNLTGISVLVEGFLKNFMPTNNEEIYYLGLIDEKIWQKYVDSVIKSQNGDGGFGFYPGTTSYLENTYFAIKIISKVSPEKSEILSKGREFVIACYNGDGGFARRPGGISYLDTTFYGVDLML